MKIRILNIILVLFFSAVTLQVYAQDNPQKYQEMIEKADKYFEQGDYMNAKASYQYAMQLNPEESYPRDKLKESIQLLRVQIEKKSQYREAIKFADELFKNGSYEKAILAYEEASGILPGEQYPREQISLIETRITELAENRKKYDEIIITANQLFQQEQWEKARAAYEEAQSYLPQENYPKEKLSEIEEVLTRLEETLNEYQQALQDAENFEKRKHYNKAIEKYKYAQSLKPEESFPQDKIVELTAFLKKFEQYNALVTEGDNLYIEQQFEKAREKYIAALAVIPNENYPRDLIKKIDEALNIQTADAFEKYEEWIVKADKLYNEEDYENAMVAYQTALSFKPDEEYASEQISAINEIINYRLSQEEAYVNSIAKADKLYEDGLYEESRNEYKKASEIKPMEQYPRVRIDDIDAILTELNNKIALYERTIEGADKLYNTGDYQQSIIQYKQALELFPNKQYPQDQITMINEILGRDRALQEAYEKAIAAADQHLDEENYENAKVEYMNALDIKPGEQYPKDQISAINDLLAEMKAAEEAYQMAVNKADRLVNEEDFEGALAEYRKASEIKTGASYPKDKIAELTSIVAAINAEKELESRFMEKVASADKLLLNKDYEAARKAYQDALELKPGEQYPTEKIEEIDLALAEIAKEEAAELAFQEKVSRADKLFENKEYELALNTYREALEIKPGASYPSERISLAEERLAAIAAERARNKEYYGLIDKADSLFAGEKYEEAKEEYLNASALKPEENYPLDQVNLIYQALLELEEQQKEYDQAIALADQLFENGQMEEALDGYKKANGIMPDEEYPKTRISEIASELARLEALDEQYNQAIADADQFFTDKEYQQAKSKYLEASELKPEVQYPLDRIAEIDNVLEEIARQKALDEQYEAIIAGADLLFNEKDFENALVKYREASELKPDEQYPKDKLTEVNDILEELARQREIEENYNKAIAAGDELFSREKWSESIEQYQAALKLKPGEEYPDMKIIEINSILEKLKEERERAYQLALTKGDNYFNEGNYLKAKESYEAALSIKPGESYPQRKISEADVFIIAEREAKEKEYRKAIGEADKFFEEKIYDNAIDKYQQAINILPNETYPYEMIDRIKYIINKNAIVDVNTDLVLINENTEKRFSFEPMPVNVRNENYILLKAKNPVERDFKMLVSFGNEDGKHGGVAIRIPESEEILDYIIRIGAQYKWFSEDNNWISVYPEGGDLEVSLIRISKSD